MKFVCPSSYYCLSAGAFLSGEVTYGFSQFCKCRSIKMLQTLMTISLIQSQSLQQTQMPVKFITGNDFILLTLKLFNHRMPFLVSPFHQLFLILSIWVNEHNTLSFWNFAD